jgi:uncharacterized protein (DUF2147 family)
MRPSLTSLILAATLAASGAVIAAAAAPPIFGLWKSADGDSAVEIAPCGEAVCGHITWLKQPRDASGQAPRDVHNHDPSLRARPICGLPIFAGLAPRPDGGWGGGKVYSAGDGSVYDLSLKPDGADRLRLRGSLAGGLIGRTFFLYRASGLPRCTA